MDDNRQICEVCRVRQVGGNVVIRILDFKRLVLHSDGRRMLATQITNLAGLGVFDVAGWVLATVLRVEVSTSGIAVTVLGNRMRVDVVRYQITVRKKKKKSQCKLVQEKGGHTQGKVLRKTPQVGMDLDSHGLRPDVDETPDSGVGLVEELGVEEFSRVVGSHGSIIACLLGWQAGHGQGEAKGSNEIEFHDCMLLGNPTIEN